MNELNGHRLKNVTCEQTFSNLIANTKEKINAMQLLIVLLIKIEYNSIVLAKLNKHFVFLITVISTIFRPVVHSAYLYDTQRPNLKAQTSSKCTDYCQSRNILLYFYAGNSLI